MPSPVTTALLTQRDPNLGSRWPSGQSSWQPQIDLGARDVRRELRLRGFDWTRFMGYAAGGGFAEDYNGTNEEVNDLLEARALEIVYRACARSEPERWRILADKFENLFAALLERYAGTEPPGRFTTYDVDGSGQVAPDETAAAKSNPPMRL